MNSVPRDDSRLERIRRWKKGERPGPWTLLIHPTDRCNLNCIMCWRRKYPVNTANEMSDERILRLVDEAAELDVREITMVGHGEPTLRGELVMELCRRIRARGITGIVHGNGTLYKPEQIEELVEMGWPAITMSIEGPNAEIGNHIRGKAAFERATDAMRMFAAAKRRKNSPIPFLQVFLTVNTINYRSLPAMIDLVHEIGADALGTGYVLGDHCREVHLGAEHMKEMPALIKTARRKAAELGVQADLTPLETDWQRPARDSLWRWIFGAPRGLSAAMCFEPWCTIQVRANGMVGPCCAAYGDGAPSVHEANLRDLWYGPYFTRVRERIAANQPMPFCDACQVFQSQAAQEFRRALEWLDVTEGDRRNTLRARCGRMGWHAAGLIKRHLGRLVPGAQ